MRRLTIDVETKPNLAYVWDMYHADYLAPDKLVETNEVICFAAKWNDSKRIIFKSIHGDGETEMTLALWSLLDEADVVVHYNGKRFDIPHINRKFVQHHMNPPSPYKQIDLFETIKRTFRFPSMKLGYVLHELGLVEKVETGGFELWTGCMANDAKSWAQMRTYNIGDVVSTEALHDYLLPWIPNYPSHGAMSGEDDCPQCGSKKLVREGYAYTQGGKFQRFRCADCGRWSRSNRRDAGTHIVGIAA